MAERWVPLFPLGLVLMPKEALPLHIFEPRYRALTERCEREQIPFGVVWAREEGLAEVGTEAWIQETLRRFPDGRRDILTVGGDRFRVRALREHDAGYLEARLESLDEEEETIDANSAALLLELHRECRRLGLVMQQGLGAPEVPLPPEEGAEEIAVAPGYTFLVAAAGPLGPSERQAVLEMTSESARESALLGLLARQRPRLEHAVQDLPHVKANGKVKPRE
ncbi:MAG: LON peptidase substrate-binding domain-containing protein [Candidatus Eisenbacteria bacterium]